MPQGTKANLEGQPSTSTEQAPGFSQWGISFLCFSLLQQSLSSQLPLGGRGFLTMSGVSLPELNPFLLQLILKNLNMLQFIV